MKCPVCASVLIERTGKFGPFICCPKSNAKANHGTFSRQGSVLHLTGAIGDALRPRIPPPSWQDMRTLSQIIDEATFALLPGGVTDMDRFLERSDEAACSRNQIDELEHPDDWRNQRPY